jgi:hypothetical protein
MHGGIEKKFDPNGVIAVLEADHSTLVRALSAGRCALFRRNEA